MCVRLKILASVGIPGFTPVFVLDACTKHNCFLLILVSYHLPHGVWALPSRPSSELHPGVRSKKGTAKVVSQFSIPLAGVADAAAPLTNSPQATGHPSPAPGKRRFIGRLPGAHGPLRPPLLQASARRNETASAPGRSEASPLPAAHGSCPIPGERLNPAGSPTPR